METTHRKDHEPENFDAMVARRRCEAQRSIVVELPCGSTAEDVWRECSAVGKVTTLMQYDTQKKYLNNVKTLLLVEFAESGCVTELMRHTLSAVGTGVPVRSPFFACLPESAMGSEECLTNKKSKATEESSKCWRAMEMPKVFRENIFSDEELYENLLTCSSISEQIKVYYDSRKLSELGSRLRFLTCRQIEVTLSGPLPYATATPFGSSVNGFGHSSSDLDVVFELQSERWRAGSPAPPCPGLRLLTPSTELVRQRSLSHRYLELVADLLCNVTPGCHKMVKILRARVPIVKYQQELTGLECDLSINNWSGIYMSEMLYHYSLLDRRVAPLVFCLRLWAKRNSLTSVHPGRWITNFSITMLALYYLVRVGMLPSFRLLQRHARPEDKRVREDDIDCTFLRDLPLISALHDQHGDVASEDARHLTLEQLLHGFFAFYDEFDFANRGLGIIDGKSFLKPVQCGMYIQNPLDPSLNVSRNVTLEEVDRFCLAANRERHAPMPQQSSLESSPDWGLLSWLSSNNKRDKSRSSHLNAVWSNIFPIKGPTSASSSAPSPVTHATMEKNDTVNSTNTRDPTRQSINMRADVKSRESSQPSLVSTLQRQQPPAPVRAQAHQHHNDVAAMNNKTQSAKSTANVRNNSRNKNASRTLPKHFVTDRKS